MQIATVRDEIAALNDIMVETKHYREDVEKKLKVLEDHASVCMNDSHSHVVADLKAKFSQRENVFAVSFYKKYIFKIHFTKISNEKIAAKR